MVAPAPMRQAKIKAGGRQMGKNIIVGGKRYDTSTMRLISDEPTQVGTGVTREEIWITPRSKL